MYCVVFKVLTAFSQAATSNNISSISRSVNNFFRFFQHIFHSLFSGTKNILTDKYIDVNKIFCFFQKFIHKDKKYENFFNWGQIICNIYFLYI